MKRSILAVSIVLALLFTTACSLNVGGDRLNFSGNVSYDKGTTLTEEQNIARNAAETEKLEISDTAGNITVKASTSGDISIKAIKKVKGTNNEIKKEVMENIDIVVEGSGNKLSIYPSTKDGKKDDLWKWVERLYKGTQVSIDFELEVPENIKVYAVDSNAGNISFNDVKGEIAIKSNAGNVDMNAVSLAGSNDIEINAGNVSIDADISKASKLTLVNTAGNITLKLPANSEFDLMAKLTAGNVSGSFLSGSHIISGTVKKKINGGGTEVHVTTVAGNVTIDSK
jgi:hypothetical protein